MSTGNQGSTQPLDQATAQQMAAVLGPDVASFEQVSSSEREGEAFEGAKQNEENECEKNHGNAVIGGPFERARRFSSLESEKPARNPREIHLECKEAEEGNVA